MKIRCPSFPVKSIEQKCKGTPKKTTIDSFDKTGFNHEDIRYHFHILLDENIGWTGFFDVPLFCNDWTSFRESISKDLIENCMVVSGTLGATTTTTDEDQFVC